jgi:ubiquinone/menaquinone biosynthesis C-methylase UbiE
MTEKEIIEKYNQLDDDSVIFMNDGYCPLDEDGYPTDIDIDLSKKYKRWKYQVYMYKILLDFIKVTQESSRNKKILDVGCGRGGGLSFFKDYYNFKELYGIDLNPYHKKIAESHTKGINFYTSSATTLPFEDKSFDIITCVESSPYYDPFEDYVKEIKRVLKINGIYVRAERYIQTPDYFLNGGFLQVKQLDINYNVRIACSISKWTSLNFSKEMSQILFLDEMEYVNDNASYNITSYIKKSLD